MPVIYVENKPLHLMSQTEGKAQHLKNQPGIAHFDGFKPSLVSEVLQLMAEKDTKGGVIIHSNLSELMDAFTARLTLIQAAGGLVYTDNDELLLIFRRGKWDLPKGKLDEGEDLPACAVREVAEETGLSNVTIEKPLTVTYHTYWQKDTHILKESHWYLMKTPEALALNPQIEEDIERCDWIPVSALESYTANMHASLLEVLSKGIGLIAKRSR